MTTNQKLFVKVLYDILAKEFGINKNINSTKLFSFLRKTETEWLSAWEKLTFKERDNFFIIDSFLKLGWIKFNRESNPFNIIYILLPIDDVDLLTILI